MSLKNLIIGLVVSLVIIQRHIVVFGQSNNDKKNGDNDDNIPLLLGMEIMEPRWHTEKPDNSISTTPMPHNWKGTTNDKDVLGKSKKTKKDKLKKKLRLNKEVGDEFHDALLMEHTTNNDQLYNNDQSQNGELVVDENSVTVTSDQITPTHNVPETEHVTDQDTDESTPMTTITTKKYLTTSEHLVTIDPLLCNCEIFDNISLSLEPAQVKIARSSAVTLNCSIGSAIPQNIKWTFSWGIQRYNKEKSTENKDLFGILTLSNITLEDTGIYSCTLLSLDGCCSKKVWSYVNVYEVPSYTPVLIIIGSVCASQLLLCIPITICRRKQILLSVVDPGSDEEKQLL